MRNSTTYKTYLAFATRVPTLTKARKFKKPASPSKTKTLVDKKSPVKSERSKGIELLSKAALLEKARLKKAIKQSKQKTNIHQAGGSSEGADLESEFPDEPKGKSFDTSEGTGLIPRVPDVSKADSSKSEYESWGDSDDDNDDDHHQSDDEQTEYDNPRTKSIIEDEDAMDKGVANKSKKRKPDDADRDEGPPVGPDQGLKRKKTSKDAKPSM
nr:hypothetical protein [Tanacetum cinerariifolium]